VSYLITVSNGGTAVSQDTNVLVQLPGGVGLEYVTPPCVPGPAIISCPVPQLQPGATISYTFGVTADAGPGQIVVNAIVDPSNLIVESAESNNQATTATIVGPYAGPPPGAFPPPQIPQPPVAQEPPAVPPAPPAPAPEAVTPPIGDVAGVQVTPPQAQVGEQWLQVLAPTQAYSIEMEPLWMAAPGEWYIVNTVEDGWALAVWEGDTTGWTVWMQMDQRVMSMTIDRPDPQIATDIWLLTYEPTEAYSATTGSIAWVAGPGEWYRVLQYDASWALVSPELDPSQTVWIFLDPRVDIGPADAPHMVG
jgi:hypothetical protein